MSSEPLQDPLNVLSPEMVKALGPIRGIETRIDQEINKHAYEICLKETYFRTIHWFKGKRHISHYHRKKHLFKLKQDIIHHCLANDLDPLNHLEEGSWGNFIVMPEIESSLYFGMLANRLYITPANGVRTFLDFHYTNWTILNEQSPQPFGYFLKNLSFLVLLHLERNMPHLNEPVLEEARKWIASQFVLMTFEELKEYHSYYDFPYRETPPLERDNSIKTISSVRKKHPKALENTQSGSPDEPGITRKVDHGSSKIIIENYFALLKQPNPANGDKKPFVDDKKVNFLLKEYFGLSDAGPADSNSGYTITRYQIAFFIHRFNQDLQVQRTGTSLKKQDLVEMVTKEFPKLFQGKSQSVYNNWARDAYKGYHQLLDWKKHKVISNHVNLYKENKPTIKD